jgi:uncharacterized protein YjbI with pentapeptide repeats
MVAIVTATLTQWLWRRTLSGKPIAGALFLAPFRATDLKVAVLYAGLVLLVVIGPLWVSYAAIEGDLGRHKFFAADFSDKDVSSRPENWSDVDDPVLSKVRGADLHGHNLKYLRADDSFLAKADLQNTNLASAQFLRADLRYAHFRGSTLTSANFEGAKLNGADFQRAYLGDAKLNSATLIGADLSNLRKSNGVALSGAVLQNAQLQSALLPNAVLPGANLQGACLQDADLTGADLRFVKLDCADLSYATLVGANLSGVRSAECATFRETNLKGAVLKGAQLTNTRWENSDLGGVDLREANLSRATGLTPDLMGKALVDQSAIFASDATLVLDCTALCGSSSPCENSPSEPN